jgi:formylglycine-generating enzyme required for sulfatase activity
MKNSITKWRIGIGIASVFLLLFAAMPAALAQPAGMMLVPAGSFQMGDNLNDGYSDELPVHTVYVSAFYMDQQLVTQALWDSVYLWATTNGYSFDYAGAGKGANYPVQRIDWYDAVKWCNARSEQGGLTPCYYTDATLTTVYRSGQIDLANNFVNWSANSYRLPTEAEWEKAARGGLAGHRFPWGDTISESEANYYSGGGFAYDLSNTGYNPTYNDGVIPYTSPVGAFAANGYGLYDMAGNTAEWCWDWYDGTWYGNAEATQNDTHGPNQTVNLRIMRGGTWALSAYVSRCAFRNNYYPFPLNSGFDFGFRCVMGTFQASNSPTVIFSDDFNTGIIDTNKWTTNGFSIEETPGVMHVETDATDNGGVLASVPVPMSPTGDITISRNVFVHYANDNYVGYIEISFGGLPWASVNYANATWSDDLWLPRYGTYIGRNIGPSDNPPGGAWGHAIARNNVADMSDSFPVLWDTWFNEKIIYSPTTGVLQYFVNGTNMTDYFIGVMTATNNPTIQFGFQAWGWYTGHEELFDSFVVTQDITSPLIVTQPQSQTAQNGASAVFSVVAYGQQPLSYQWQFNGQNIAGQTAASLSLTNVQFTNAGGYSLVVTNAYGSVTSSLASLVIQGDPANWNPSFVSVAPQSTPADGQNHVTATVTLLDKNCNPLVGRTVQFYAQGSTDPIPPPAHPTDGSGRTTTTITAMTPGKVTIGAIDVSDSFPVPNTASVQFTDSSVVPGTDLSGAIAQLASSSATVLANSMASYATIEGQDGDYFKATFSSDERANDITALFTGIGGLITLLGPENDLIEETAIQVATSEGISVGLDVGSIGTGAALDAIAISDTGLATYGQKIASGNYNYQQSELQREQQLLKGVPPAAQSLSSAYTSDIALRVKANEDLDLIALAQQNLIADLRLQSEQAHIDLLSKAFIPLNMVGTLAQDASLGAGTAGSVALDLAEALATYAANQPNLPFGANAVNTVVTAMLDCSYYSRQIDGNTESAYAEIAEGRSPSPITGKISSVNSVLTYEPPSGWEGLAGTLVGWFAGKTYVTVTGAYSVITIQNNSQQTATYSANAVYSVTTAIEDQIGDALVSVTFPYVASASVSIPANQSAQVTLNYGNEAAPDVSQPITIYLLGYDNNNGIYEADFATSYAQWQLDNSAISVTKPKPLGGPSPQGGPDSTTNLFAMEYPINAYVVPNPSNQTYQAHIVVANPFSIPLFATVTQPLPPDITILSTTGLSNRASIVWTNAIVTNGLVDDTFTFTFPVLPGIQTNLPAPTLVFSDSTGTNSWTMQGAAPAFTGLFPIQVGTSIPSGTFGVDTPMQITITNLVVTNQSGNLTVLFTDLNGNAVTNYSTAFSVNGTLGTNLNLTLPGNIPVGQYFLTGTLSMDGGFGQVLSGVYVVQPTPFMLHAGVAGLAATNGVNSVNLSLQGPIGSNYLIEASADLINWTPLIYFTSTNSSTAFTDTTATNSSERFYRASIISVVAASPTLQAQISESNIVLVWPSWAQNFSLQTTTNLADPSSWTTLTNVPIVANLQSTVTNPISDGMRFYRLKK